MRGFSMRPRHWRVVGLALALALVAPLSYLLTPRLEGTSEVGRIVRECDVEIQCAHGVLVGLAQTATRATVLATVHDLMDWYHRYAAYCHDNAHHVGRFLYSYMGDIRETIARADLRCGAGLMHGATQQHFYEHPAPQRIDIYALCPAFDDNPYSLYRRQCVHGIGHAVTWLLEYDVLAAVGRCDGFTSPLDRSSCAKGAFMENVDRYAKTRGGAFKDEDPSFPCSQAGNAYAGPCYVYQADRYLVQTRYDFAAALSRCDAVGEADLIRYCYYGIGQNAIVRLGGLDDLERAQAACSTGLSPYRGACYRALAISLANLRSFERAFEACRSAPPDAKRDCYDGLGVLLRMLSSEPRQREAQCRLAEDQLSYEACMDEQSGTMDLHAV